MSEDVLEQRPGWRSTSIMRRIAVFLPIACALLLIACSGDSECTSNDQCSAGYECVSAGGVLSSHSVCLPEEGSTQVSEDAGLDVEPPDIDRPSDVGSGPNGQTLPDPDVDGVTASDADVAVSPSCDDGKQSGEQTDIDCGGPNCPPCQGGMKCDEGGDCISELCTDGSCEDDCADHQTRCDGQCVDTDNNDAHCGQCGEPCTGIAVCSGGACVDSCPSGQDACNGGCHNFDSSDEHCGECGNSCSTDEECQDGSCVCANACCSNSDCAFNEECQGGSCVCTASCCRNSDCEGSAECEGGSCVCNTECCTGDDCPGLESCIQGSCTCSSSDECCFDEDCPGTQECHPGVWMGNLDNHCVCNDECCSTSDCSGDDLCSNRGQCIAPDTPCDDRCDCPSQWHCTSENKCASSDFGPHPPECCADPACSSGDGCVELDGSSGTCS